MDFQTLKVSLIDI